MGVFPISKPRKKMASSSTSPPEVHRSRQFVAVQDRAHLHDGLRYMTANIAKAHGWHLPNVAVQGLSQESDKLEDQLYRGTHEMASCTLYLCRHLSFCSWFSLRPSCLCIHMAILTYLYSQEDSITMCMHVWRPHAEVYLKSSRHISIFTYKSVFFGHHVCNLDMHVGHEVHVHHWE